MLTGVYETLRSAGRELVLELGERPSLAERDRGAPRGGALPRRDGAGRAQRSPRAQALELSSDAAPSGCSTSRGLDARGERAASLRGGAQARRAGGARRARRRATARCCRSCSTAFAGAYQAAKDRESALDFEDLQLRARDLLRDDAAIREREQLRFRVDHGRRVPGHEPAAVRADRPRSRADAELFFVGDEFQSIYGFRHADVQVFRERRAQPATACCR